MRTPMIGAAAALLLAGCASLNSITADVSSHSQWPSGRSPASYTFERLPSQQADLDQQARLEEAARPALFAAGFSEASDPAKADTTVQVSSRLARWDRYSPWDDPFYWGAPYGMFGWGSGFHGRRSSIGIGLHYAPPTYSREVALLIRDRKSGTPLYETRAIASTLSGGDSRMLAGLFEAAMKDFPQQAVNPRRVTVEVPR